jgi:hypothetical protein
MRTPRVELFDYQIDSGTVCSDHLDAPDGEDAADQIFKANGVSSLTGPKRLLFIGDMLGASVIPQKLITKTGKSHRRVPTSAVSNRCLL